MADDVRRTVAGENRYSESNVMTSHALRICRFYSEARLQKQIQLQTGSYPSPRTGADSWRMLSLSGVSPFNT